MIQKVSLEIADIPPAMEQGVDTCPAEICL